MTQAQLSAAAQLDRSALAKIESGTRQVSALELARLADALNARIEWFVEDEPAPLVSRRNSMEPGAPSPAIDAVVERITRSVLFVREHDPHFTVPPTEPKPMPTTVAECEALANATRDALGVGMDEPLTGIVEQAEKLGLLTFSLDLGEPPEAADAATMLLETGGVALVNGRLKVGRRRLALAHEIGHFLVADDYTVDWRVAAEHNVERREQRLDRFARALLLPAEALRRQWASLRAGPEGSLRTAAIKLASAYRVDMSTLARRLHELKVIDGGTAGTVREIRTKRADIVDLDLVVSHELAPPVLPTTFVRAVLGLYRKETISAARVLDLLLDTWPESELPDLPQRAEQAIWQYV
jgi:Zn-dependent peptidase ImmA (M78 family)/transcriptional regulator with XRE-family HTH domain